MKKLKENITFISSIFGIVSFIITIILWIKVDQVDNWIENKVEPLDVSIKLSYPRDSIKVKDYIVPLSGKVNFNSKKFIGYNSDIGLEIRKRYISLIPLVRTTVRS